MEIKYHLDESVANAVANGLGHRGIDVTTSKAAGLIGASDLQQLDYAMKQDRVLVTHDDDFLRIHAAGRRAHRRVLARHEAQSNGNGSGLLASCLCPLSPNIRQVFG
jgi:predicted nuclease of predicted toxin-antitoxin system